MPPHWPAPKPTKPNHHRPFGAYRRDDMSAYHKSNFGDAYSGPTDRNGYILTTAKEWQAEGLDRFHATAYAAASREAIRSAERAVSEWRNQGTK